MNQELLQSQNEMQVGHDPVFQGRRCVHTWNIQGLRIEFDIDRSELSIWISPQAGKDSDIHLRNFSNRDNYTSLFQRIRFSSLNPARFVDCAYDPFHLAFEFEDEVVHLAQHPDLPAVFIWCEKGTLVVDIQSDKQDSLLYRDAAQFVTRHPDRGLHFTFAAQLGAGAGSFWLPPAPHHNGRSAYARVGLETEQMLILTGELESEPVVQNAASWLEYSPSAWLDSIESSLRERLDSGRLELGEAWRDRETAQRLLDLNRRLYLTYQDASGVLRDGPRVIYCLNWVRQGMNAPLADWAGLNGFSEKFSQFSLANPTRDEEGLYYGQLFGSDGKQQEDGLFYVVWASHCRALETGEGMDAPDIDVQLAALDWLDQRCWDEEMGLYGRYFACETPFQGSRDFGWDAPTAMPVSWRPFQHKGRIVKRSFDVYINLIQYSTMRMLATHVTDAGKRDALLERCAIIDRALSAIWDDRDGAYATPYGWLEFDDGHRELVEEADFTDHVWGLMTPLFTPPSMPVVAIRKDQAEKCGEAAKTNQYGPFLFGYTWGMLAADPLWRDPAQTLADFERILPMVDQTSALMPMRGAVPECLNVRKGSDRDMRPCGFSVGQWICVPYSLGLRRLAQGWAVRGTDALKRIPRIRLNRATVEILWQGGNPLCGVTIDGQALLHSLVLPEKTLGSAHHTIVVGGEPSAGPVLVDTEARLLNVVVSDSKITYQLYGHGPSRCRFEDGAEHIVDLQGNGLLEIAKKN